MARRHAISDRDRDRIKDLLPGRAGMRGRPALDNRLFLDAVLQIGKTGAPWRDLPERFGKWNTAQRRFDRRARKGLWRKVFDKLQDPDLEWLILDSTIIRAHPCAAGAANTAGGTGGQDEQALGRSRGGFGTKIHAAVSGLMLPVAILLGAGREADISHAKALLDAAPAGAKVAAVIADKGYDSTAFGADVEARKAEAVVPTLPNRKEQREYDKHLNKERNLAELFPGKIKHFCRVATRYEKTARNFLAFFQVASIMVLLR